MILLIEPNARIRKRLCDLLPRERIIGIDSYTQTLEMICKFKANLSIIIAYIRLLREIVARQTLFRLCKKLYIDIPPVLAFYKKGDEKIKEEFENDYSDFMLIKYDSDDTSFPEHYISLIRELYPKVIADVEEATHIWVRAEEPPLMTDPHAWLIEQGFLKALKNQEIRNVAKDIREIVPLIRKMLAETSPSAADAITKTRATDYKKMYAELKRKYDLLVKYLRELAHTTRAQ
jgi:hypothetical protein